MTSWDSWHLVDPQGRRTSAGAAVAPLLDLLPAGAPAAAVARALPGPVERTYRLVALNRATVGRLVGDGGRAWAELRIARREYGPEGLRARGAGASTRRRASACARGR